MTSDSHTFHFLCVPRFKEESTSILLFKFLKFVVQKTHCFQFRFYLRYPELIVVIVLLLCILITTLISIWNVVGTNNTVHNEAEHIKIRQINERNSVSFKLKVTEMSLQPNKNTNPAVSLV